MQNIKYIKSDIDALNEDEDSDEINISSSSL